MTDSTIPAHWDISDPSTWTLSTTVDAHMGYHHTGIVVREYQEIRHSAHDLGYARDIEPTRDHAEWWANVLTALHDADIAIAEASPEALDAAADALDDYRAEAEDLERQAAAARNITFVLTAFEEEEEPTKPTHTTGDHLRSADEYY